MNTRTIPIDLLRITSAGIGGPIKSPDLPLQPFADGSSDLPLKVYGAESATCTPK